MPFEAHTSRARVAIQLGAALMFVAIGAAMVWNLGVPGGWLAIAGFGLWFVILLPGLFRLRLELRVDANGIWWRRWSDQTILWSAIRRMHVLDVENTRSITLYLADSAASPSMRRRAGFGDLAIKLNGTDRNFDELVAAVRRFAPPSLAF
ncbi:hypothetical protein [Sphingomonas bacterium]|uniref:hypothetical protein n=1 Tax=Sphingomonas bacterium TaxID=1895847 RepID=UPI002635C32F|nr:hypothetical protein [Sphingomonas bacterium]MDB5677944.1 hypothetical protein [Sphingomonas bacterium]